MFRFFVTEKINNSFVLSKEVLKHLKVVRKEDAEFICVFEKKFYVCELSLGFAKIKSELNEDHEFSGEVVLAAGLLKTKAWELLIQKATELGATKIIPVLSKNVTQKIYDMDSKMLRWNKIALGASEQSFRNTTPIIENPISFSELLKLEYSNKVLAHELEASNEVQTVPVDSLLAVGPEGGFTSEEASMAKDAGFNVVTLGKRILRAETASLMLLSRVENQS